MKLAISHIAWNPNEDNEITALLKPFGVKGVELAPAKVYPEPEHAADTILRKYKSLWEEHDIEIVAMQSLLFNRPNLSIFGAENEETKQYLYSIIEMAGKLSAKALVFGSPKNRLVGEMSPVKAREQAVGLFYELGNKALQHGVYLCLEANPAEYGCDFITGTLEALQLVKDINHKAVKLQLDTGTMLMNEEDPEVILEKCLPETGHFHISEPYLQPIGQSDHSLIAKALKEQGYEGWVSIEMKNNPNQGNTEVVRSAIEYVMRTYLS